MRINYKAFIEDNFYIKNKEGVIVPMKFNATQDYYYGILKADYPTLQGIRENILKFRQPGFSSLITGIFATDFIMSELGEIPIVDADIYSHKDSETDAHIARFNMFIDSWMLKDLGGDYSLPEHRKELPRLRKQFLAVDNGGELVSKKYGAQYHAQTASAKVSGRGGTKQNVHWSEAAFYPNTPVLNAKQLVTGAEQQVPDGIGKIFRETTGNLAADFFAEEYKKGKEGKTPFKSRFLPWYIHREYTRPAPEDWEPPAYYDKVRGDFGTTVDQCYWHFIKTGGLLDKELLREYPTYDTEAFLLGGKKFFDAEALIYYSGLIKDPIKESPYVSAL